MAKVTAVQIHRSDRYDGHGRWHVANPQGGPNVTICRRVFRISDRRVRVIEADDDDGVIDWCKVCDARGATPTRTAARLRRLANRAEPPTDGYGREHLLRDLARALAAAFPDRHEGIMREVEKRLQ